LRLVRAFVDLGDLGVAHHALHREFAGIAVAAEYLDSISAGVGLLITSVPLSPAIQEPGRLNKSIL
jgi:hypothetical protein